MHRYALGVDIGGTKVSVTLGNSRGKILAKKLLPTLTGKNARQGIHDLAAALKELKLHEGKGKKIQGIGVGVPGPMDPKKGIIEKSPHLHGWQGFPLKSFLGKKLKLPIFMANDADAAAVGEKVFGQGHGAKNFVYVTISTGIGSGIMIDGRPLDGAAHGAGEFGHTIICPDGEKCGCGRKGCLEAYASGTAIAQYYRNISQRTFPNVPGLTAERIAWAAKAKDRLALQAFRRAGYFLGIGLANLINLLDPELIILGGSVIKSSEFFWPEMIESARSHSWPSLFRACRIVKTRLGNQVGDLGALALVFAHSRS